MNWLQISKTYVDSTIMRGIVNAIPHIGGTLDVFLSAESERLANKRIEKFIKATGEKAAQLDEKKVDKDFIRSPKFFEIFQEVISQIKHTYEDEKIEFLRNAFLNSIQQDQSQNPLIFSFLEIIRVVDIAHIQILKLFYRDRGDVPSDLDDKMNRFPRYARIIGFSQDTYNLLIDDLLRLRLLEKQGIGGLGVGGGWPEISDFGKAFIEFILE